MGIDATDQKIINLLLDNSKLSFRQIAEKTGLSAATVMKRVHILEKEGAIKKYTTLLDYEKIGYSFDVIIEVRVSHGRLKSV